MGRVRLLESCRRLPCRVADEKTGFFKIGRMNDIMQSGVKEVLGVESVKGHRLKCSKDHQILTADGWAKAGDLRKGDRIAVCGKVPIPGDRICPPALRRGIGVWTSMQRKRLIKPTDKCDGCRYEFKRDDLVLDHAVPVVTDLKLALDLDNLRPYCTSCHRIKTNAEQVHATGRGGTAGVKFVAGKESPWIVGEEMTYDISMDGPHHNFVANGVVVHNSYNEESARYKVLEPVFYVPPRDRPMVKVGDWKPGRPKFLTLDEAVAAEYSGRDFPTPQSRNAAVLAESDRRYAGVVDDMKAGYAEDYPRYLRQLGRDLDPGLARDGLPVGIYSACWVSLNPRSLMHFLSLRTHDPEAAFVSYPLYEMERAARLMEGLLAKHWPVTYSAWDEFGRVAP